MSEELNRQALETNCIYESRTRSTCFVLLVHKGSILYSHYNHFKIWKNNCELIWFINEMCGGPSRASIYVNSERSMRHFVQEPHLKPMALGHPNICMHSPTRCWCSSACGSVRFLSCWSNNGYLRILCIGLMRYDSSVEECCWRGFRAARNSWSAWLPSSE
jgi:hypothetical protein